jgi:hypothetical protein
MTPDDFLATLTEIADALDAVITLHRTPGYPLPPETQWSCHIAWTASTETNRPEGTFFATASTMTGSIANVLDRIEAAYPPTTQEPS